MKKGVPALCVALLILSALNGPVCAQDTTPSIDANSPTLRVTTRMVVVDVVALDAAGKPVTSLTKNDFTILENGRPQAITAFNLQAASNPPAKPVPLLQPHVTTNRPDLRESNAPAVVLLLDGLNTSGKDQVRVRQQMLRYLAEHFDPHVKMAVMVLTSELHVLQDFTSDPMLLNAALNRFRPQVSAAARSGNDEDAFHNLPDASALPAQASGAAHDMQLDPAMARTSGGANASIAEKIAYLEERFEKETENFARDTRVNITLAALSNISRYMAAQKGRKSILWFSAGFPLSVTGFDAADLGTSRDYTDQLRKTTNLLSDAHIAIYTIDARGLMGEKMADITERGTTKTVIGPELNRSLSAESNQRFNEENTLQDVASETGGQYFAGNDLSRAIAESVRDTSTYYLIGYYPEDKKWDGKFRRIQVKVSRPGIHLLHRNGYFATDPFDWRKHGADKVLTATLGSDPLLSTEVLFFARALPPARHADVNVEFLVDPNTITFETESENKEYCSLQFDVEAYSTDGKLVRAEVQTAEAPLRHDTYERVRTQGIPMSVPIKLPPGAYMLRLGVRDNRTGQIGTAALPVEVPN